MTICIEACATAGRNKHGGLVDRLHLARRRAYGLTRQGLTIKHRMKRTFNGQQGQRCLEHRKLTSYYRQWISLTLLDDGCLLYMSDPPESEWTTVTDGARSIASMDHGQ